MNISPKQRRSALTGVIGVALICIAAWPAVATGLSALHLDWHPSGDWALLSMRIEDVGHTTPLLGPYSRFGWNHPGPLLYWVLAAPYHRLGWSARSMLAATAFLNATALGGSVALAWRRGRLPLAALSALALSLLTHTMGPELLRDPWNPYITMLPVVLFVLLCWSGVEGDRWAWPLAIAVGSFVVQSHIGYALIIVGVLLTAAVLSWRNRREVPILPVERRARALLVATTILVTFVCWIPVLIDQFFDTGNLGAIASYFLHSSDHPAGLHDAVAQAAANLPWRDSTWLGTLQPTGADGAVEGGQFVALLLPLVAFALALVAALLTRARSAARFQILTGVAVASGVLATSRITGPIFGYLIRWWWVLAMLWWLSIIWSFFEAAMLASRSPAAIRRILPLVVVALGLLSSFRLASATAHAADRALPPEASNSLLLHDLLPPLIGTLGTLPEVHSVRVETVNSTWGTMADGVRFELNHKGISVVVDPGFAYKFGEQRSANRVDADAVVWVVHSDAVRIWGQLPNVRTIAIWDPLTTEERAAYVVDETLLQQQLNAAGRPDLASALTNGGGGVDTGSVGLPGVDQDLVTRVESIRRKGDPIGLFLSLTPH
jgi:hypothetical protein